MKIALVTDDEKTICQHFGRAQKYIVFSVEDGKIIDRQTLPKAGHHHQGGEHHHHEPDPRGSGFGQHAKQSHAQMFANIADCDMLVTRGMGRGAYLDAQQHGLRPIITDIAEIETAVQAVINESIVDHTEKLH